MTTFNFQSKERTQEVLDWIRENHKKEISESQFLEAMEKFRHLRSRKKRTPSINKKDYRNLKKKFGFFKASQ